MKNKVLIIILIIAIAMFTLISCDKTYDQSFKTEYHYAYLIINNEVIEYEIQSYKDPGAYSEEIAILTIDGNVIYTSLQNVILTKEKIK